MPLTNAHLSSVCEIRNMANDLITTGILETITPDHIEIVPKSGFMPVTEYGVRVKVNIYNSRAGFRALEGTVYTSSEDFIQIAEVEILAEEERRNFFRVDTQIHGQMTVRGRGGSSRELNVTVDNISLNGAGITSPEELEVGSAIRLRLKLLHTPCAFDGKVQRSISANPAAKEYKYGCILQEGNHNDRDTLCSFIFMMQRQQLHRRREGGGSR